tara:strand:+ start:19984 stop:20724 length:741 start_codon:yes stop_codon:yes gene_type:complete
MNRFILVYALCCYVLFGVVFAWFAVFLLNVGDLRGPARASVGPSFTVNLGLITLFCVAHSVMARPAFKRVWTQIIPPAGERATYVLQSSVLLGLIIWQWHPIPTVVWHIDGIAACVIFGAFAIGAVIILASTFLLGHFEFVGLSQALDNLRGVRPRRPAFRTPMLYRIVRHPLQLGLLIMMISTPVMTLGHLIFVSAMLLYILIGLQFEERALLREFGSSYATYKREVPMLIPNPFRRPVRREAAE